MAIGEIRIHAENGRYHLIAREADSDRGLRALAAVAGISVRIGELPVRTVSGELENATLHQALSFVVGQAPYTLHYDPGDDATHHLVEVRVGDEAPAAEAGYEPGAAPTFVDEPEDSLIGRWQEAHADQYARLFDPDESVRVSAVQSIEIDEAGLAQLRWLLRNEPNARLRKAVIEHLDDDDSDFARQLVLESITDPDPVVLDAVLDVIEAWDDPTLTPRLLPLRDHWDAGIRARIEDLQ